MTTETRPAFTPGPWEFHEEEADGCSILKASSAAENGWETIAVLSDDMNTYAANRANGPLIAAAPELYAALDTLLFYVDKQASKDECYACGETITRGEGRKAEGHSPTCGAETARAALAKADGR